jgi:hypothetical protein
MKRLTEEVRDALSQFFSPIPIGEEECHGWEEAPMETVRIHFLRHAKSCSPFKET